MDMASAEMPGGLIKATATYSKKQEHLVNGRRKLDEYRKKKAEEKKSGNKNSSHGKPIENDVHVLDIIANGSCLGHGVQKNDNLHLHTSNVVTNGLDTLPISEPSEDKVDGAAHKLWLERAIEAKGSIHRIPTVSENVPPSRTVASTAVQLFEESLNSRSQNPGVSTSKLSSHISSLAGSVREQLPWIGEGEQAEQKLDNDLLVHKPGVSANQDFIPIKQEKSTKVVLDGVSPSRITDSSQKRPPFGALFEGSKGSLHESSLALPASKHESDIPALSLALSSTDEKDGRGQEKLVSQFRSSGLSNGIRYKDDTEWQFPFLQPRKSVTSDLEGESIFPKRTFDQPAFQPLHSSNPAPLAAVPLTTSSGSSWSSSAHEARLPDQGRDSNLRNHSEEREKRLNNEDFDALEQHIDDLTQEKYSLQRALDAARSLAESLLQQNSAFTEDFNSQGATINQLQADLEKKEEELAAQSLVLSSLMMERERAQQENNSAVERSQILAGEVIGLEEKVLKLRSSELKLQREMETLKSENDSYRGHLAMLEKDRQNMRSMLEALQEDKKLLQKTIVSGSSKASSKKDVRQTDSRDASTSTEDLGMQNMRARSLAERYVADAQLNETLDNTNEASASTMISPFSRSVGFSGLPAVATLSADDFKYINSIDALITELLSEKRMLLEMLSSESSKASELETLNMELSKKLETQTQRLELVVAQSMAREGNVATTNSLEMEQHHNDYVDEGDEVVEQVFGWIMRLFPGGSSRRQSSKHL